MRITRSTLRRLIAEESARLLREAAFPEEIEGVYGEAPPEDGGGDGIPKMLHVMYRGFRPVFIVTDVDANPLGEEAEDVTQQIQPAKSNMTTPELAQAIIDFITDPSNSIMYVFDEEMNDSETDEKFETEDYVEHLEGLISSGEEEAGSRGGEMHKRAVERGEDEDLFEGDEPLDEMEDPEYNEYLQQQHGRFTSPENVKGTPEYTAKHRQPTAPKQSSYVSRRSEWGDEDLFGGPPRVDEGGPGDDFLDYDPEEIPDMDDQYDPEYDEEFMGDDDSWMDYETGEDDVPYGAADVALRKGRGHRTDEGHDPLDSSDYEGSRHHRAYSDDPDDESGKVDRWGEPIPYLKHDSEATDLDAAAEDEMAGEEEDWSWDGYDYEPDLKRTSRFAHTAQKYKETGNSDPGMDPDDHIFGRPRGLDESDYDDYEHAYAMGGGPDEEGFAIDYDTGRPSPFAAKHLPKPRPAVDDVEGPDQDDVWGDDDMGRKGARDDYEHAWKMGGGRDEDGFAMDYDKLDEARWAKLAGILKG